MTLQCSHKRVLPHSLALSIGLGMGLWMITASGFNSSQVVNNVDSSPQKRSANQQAIYGTTNQTLLVQQRDLFTKAENALSKRQYHAFDTYSSQLKNYPLYPYLVYRKMLRQIGQLSRDEIDQFFNRYSDNQLAERFKYSLLKYYARHQRWDDYLYYYTEQDNTSLQCHRLTALIKTGKKNAALKLVEPLWLSARSQPSVCNYAFTTWREAGFQTQQLTWKRIQLAMDKGRIHLAKHLAKSLNKIDQQWVNLWIQAHRQPHVVINNPKLKITHPMSKPILLHAIRRQAIKDEDKAVTLWQTIAKQHTFTTAEKYKVYGRIGLTMARRHHPDAEKWLVQIPSQHATSDVTEWLIRTSIRHGNWDQTIQTIESMPPKLQSNLRWQFWWAYANEQLGNKLDAEGIYHYLATRRSYYGFIAADRLHLPYSFENNPLDINHLDLVELSYHSEAIRAREFYEVNKYTDSRREWHQLALKLDNREKLVASKLAQHWNWHDRAIITMGKTKYRDDIELRFPLPLKQKVTKYSKRSNVEPALTYA
ncbi:MAG: hypothetical protein OEZ38_10700, partial [Gammaproteobacteria bacterium]|nr:hypothetical protein [Gammaproteobacteria bacterium]